MLPICGEMKHWLDMARTERAMRDPNCPWVFHVEGQRMKFNWRSWNSYCKLAEVAGLHFHDLRRTALTNMVGAGNSEKVAMEVSGHLTRRTFKRYHIVSDRSVRELAYRMETYLVSAEQKAANTAPAGTLLGTPDHDRGDNLLN